MRPLVFHPSCTDCLQWLKTLPVSLLLSVCTGSGVLAKAGLLDGLEATSNKYALQSLVMPLGPKVCWKKSARWCQAERVGTGSFCEGGGEVGSAPQRDEVAPEQDTLTRQKVWTSSGVSAGGDMMLAVIATHYGKAFAEEVARRAEWVWNQDPENDPFAV